MPLFEYRCKSCGEVTEVLEKPGATGKHTCATCGSHRMEKVFSAFGLGRGSSCATGKSGFA